jgi:hypothetical protein
MSYTVTITRTEEVRRTVGRRWKLCGPERDAEYDYTPETETVQIVTEEIYKQTVEDLNVVDVISSVNTRKLAELL